MTEETKIKHQIKEYLKLKGWFSYPNVASAISYKGLADITAISPHGFVVQIEVKRPKGKQSELQKQFAEEWTSRGGNYVVVHSLDELMEGI